MRVDNRALGLFVPGHFVVPQNPVGMGMLADFVPGKFTVPENPVMRGVGDFVPGKFAVPQTPVGMGYLVPTDVMYTFDQNSVLAAAEAAGMAGLGCGCAQQPGVDDCGGCGGRCGGCSGGMQGLGTLSTDFSAWTADIQAGNIENIFTDTIVGIPVWGWVAGAYVLVSLIGDMNTGRKYASRKARGFAKA